MACLSADHLVEQRAMMKDSQLGEQSADMMAMMKDCWLVVSLA